MPNHPIGFAIKRLIDFILSLFMLIIASPCIAVVALLIKWKMGSPVFFRQIRPGYKEKLFGVIKFRTMTDERDKDGNLLPDEERMTGLGNGIRSLSIDELPQLWSVFKGDLSIVGPRPLLVEYLDRYSPEQRRRHNVKPGITGWAQINGRNNLTWEEKFEYDVWYVDNWSLWLDIKIMLLTGYKIFKREGVSQEGQATMEPFMGSKNKDNE